MTRYLAIALALFAAFLILLAEIGKLREDVEARIEKQRYFNAHQ
jgi:multisubunit Na+/H+ antiporter MnhG subunit